MFMKSLLTSSETPTLIRPISYSSASPIDKFATLITGIKRFNCLQICSTTSLSAFVTIVTREYMLSTVGATVKLSML